MNYSNILVITDNLHLYGKFREIVRDLGVAEVFTYGYSPANSHFRAIFKDDEDFGPVDVHATVEALIETYDLIISLHSKQVFPERLVNTIKCINIHPGLNPFNRGWFPQVFSIMNKLPLGSTIHEMDAEIDHGGIIDQVEVPVFSWDTSLTAYNRVIEAEIGLIKKNIMNMIGQNYKTSAASEEGNLNRKKDFDEICRLNLNEVNALGTFIDRLRALTHGEHKNAYFLDAEGHKIFVKVELESKGLYDNAKDSNNV